MLVGLAALFQIALFAIWGDTTLTSSLANGVTTGSLACVPIAIGIAILRYRLYDIDRLISRTLVYVLLTVVLGLGYAGMVLGLGQLFGGVGTEAPSWAVAGATLTVELVAVVNQTMEPTTASVWLRPSIDASHDQRRTVSDRPASPSP